MKFDFSYVLATRNRLPFLKISLQRLLNDLKENEEIVVVDGNSTDGSKEYLQQLFKEGKIHQFISESDRNQAHAWNKALLMAEGTIIKKIIDDDVFCYEAIRKCKEYMLQNTDVDIVISNELVSSLSNHLNIQQSSRRIQFEKWRDGLSYSFPFGDVHMLIRRSSLAYIGLYNTSYINMDWEYSLRISYLKANIVYYTGYNALTVAHSQTVTSLRNKNLIKEEGKRGRLFYNYPGDGAEITYWSKIKIFIGTLIYRQSETDKLADKSNEIAHLANLDAVYNHFHNCISEFNTNVEFTFIKSQ